MWRAVGVLTVFGLVSGFGLANGFSAYAQDGYAGEGGPQVPMPAIGNAGQAGGGANATRKRSSTAPVTPARKPRKSGTRARTTSQKKKTPPTSATRSERDTYLCEALQACRNEFIRCKSKIKHPDQSEAWSIAKEECGAHYKACVQKDFKSGEWFFTRWFYFKELDCG
ncbi:MAG: hypothetical protein MPJ78_04680 [Hyphomicrobiaceae bacterium]|nr:hypothetical protein [Hyphomicrobiaceae bacterium]